MATNDNDNHSGTDTGTASAPQDTLAAVTSHGGESLQPQLTSDTYATATSLNNNPWNVSPAVTSTQSELSAASSRIGGSLQGTAEPAAAAEEATPTATVPMTRANSNPVVAGSSLATSFVPVDTDNQLQQAYSLPIHATGATCTTPQAAATASDGKEEPDAGNAVRFSASLGAGASSPTQPGTDSNTPPLAQQQQQQQQQHTHSSLDIETNFVSHTNSNGASASISASANASDYQEGGRLWQAALKEAEQSSNDSVNSKQRSRFAESIMERTRSRADPNALIGTPNNNSIAASKPSMVSLGDHESSFILSTALAKKRVRVVQLLVIGLVGLLLGLLGNFFVSTSCHFATVHIDVGQNEQTFEFHFGLWKYSPIDSVFQGYPYCYKYDQNYQSEAPLVSRIANITALVAGLISISILWLYLILGVTDTRRWKWAVRMAVLAGLVQLATLYFFVGTLCQEYSCEWGPGAYLSIFTSVVWFVLACEMQYHMPVAAYASGPSAGPAAALEEPRSLVNTMEMTHLDDVTREYMTRVTGKTKDDEMPALNKMELKRVRPKLPGLYSASQTPTSTTASSTVGPPPQFHIPSPRGTYKAPDPALLEEALASPSSRR